MTMPAASGAHPLTTRPSPATAIAILLSLALALMLAFLLVAPFFANEAMQTPIQQPETIEPDKKAPHTGAASIEPPVTLPAALPQAANIALSMPAPPVSAPKPKTATAMTGPVEPPAATTATQTQPASKPKQEPVPVPESKPDMLEALNMEPLVTTKKEPAQPRQSWAPLSRTAKAARKTVDFPDTKNDSPLSQSPLRKTPVPAVDENPERAIAALDDGNPVLEASSNEVESTDTPPLLRAHEDRSLQQQGRVLLNLMEHGKGPTIQISWPHTARERDRLYHLFSQCLDMKTALWQAPATIFDNHHPRGSATSIDASRYSMFLRAPDGRLPVDEKYLLTRIAKRHGTAAIGSQPVRLFPRKLDAILLGGLKQLGGADYDRAKTITAEYALNNRGIQLADIKLDGRPIPGRLQLASGPFYQCG